MEAVAGDKCIRPQRPVWCSTHITVPTPGKRGAVPGEQPVPDVPAVAASCELRSVSLLLHCRDPFPNSTLNRCCYRCPGSAVPPWFVQILISPSVFCKYHRGFDTSQNLPASFTPFESIPPQSCTANLCVRYKRCDNSFAYLFIFDNLTWKEQGF